LLESARAKQTVVSRIVIGENGRVYIEVDGQPCMWVEEY
jgi:hypothetical protein